MAIWLIGSIVAHIVLLAKLHASEVRRSDPREDALLWVEELDASISERKPPAAHDSAPPLPQRPRRHAVPVRTTEAAAAGVTTDASTGTVATGSVEPSADGVATAGTVGSPALPRATLPPQPAQVSLWLAPIALQRMVIVRSPSALLAALPGYRDMLRGSDINPFLQLHALRVFLPGLDAKQLLLAGVHSGGEAELVRAAERIAASRERLPGFRRSSELQAASWLDGSGFDRALAVHHDAFVIGARRELPRLLGDHAPEAHVDALSKMRRGVVVQATLHDAARYLPDLASCQLRSVRLSVSDAMRLHLTAVYETTEAAAQAGTCLEGLEESASQLRWTRALLARATADVNSTQAQLRTGVTSEEIAKLLDELCWSLRRLVRA